MKNSEVNITKGTFHYITKKFEDSKKLNNRLDKILQDYIIDNFKEEKRIKKYIRYKCSNV